MARNSLPENELTTPNRTLHNDHIGNARRRELSFLARSTALYLCLLAGCNSAGFRSHWRTPDIVIDGRNSEWQDSLTYLLEDKQTSVGFQNNDRNLFVCLISANRDLQRQAMRQGLTFWFDRDGGEDKKFGFHYPVGPGRRQGSTGEDQEKPSEAENENSPNGANEVELYGSGEGDHRRMTMAEAGGLEAHIGMTNDLLVYEIEVPLADNGSHPFSIGMGLGGFLGIGVEAVRPQRPDLTGDESAIGGGGLGGRRSGGGSRERSGASGQPEPFKL